MKKLHNSAIISYSQKYVFRFKGWQNNFLTWPLLYKCDQTLIRYFSFFHGSPKNMVLGSSKKHDQERFLMLNIPLVYDQVARGCCSLTHAHHVLNMTIEKEMQSIFWNSCWVCPTLCVGKGSKKLRFDKKCICITKESAQLSYFLFCIS